MNFSPDDRKISAKFIKFTFFFYEKDINILRNIEKHAINWL